MCGAMNGEGLLLEVETAVRTWRSLSVREPNTRMDLIHKYYSSAYVRSSE